MLPWLEPQLNYFEISQKWYASIISVADLGGGGVRGSQMHPPLAASNVFLRT